MTRLTLEREHHEDSGRDPTPVPRPPLTECWALWAEYARGGARRCRDELVLHYAPLVHRVAGRVGSRLPAHVEHADLVQSGVFGLIEAIERFEPELGVRFEAYAVRRISGAILDELRAQDWVPRVVRGRARQVAAARERIESRLGRRASAADLADEVGMPVSEVRCILGPFRLISIDALAERAARRGSSLTVGDAPAGVESDPVARLEASETRRNLRTCLGLLGERDQRVLWHYYVENQTLADIGSLLGVTESRVCQLRGRAIVRLRRHFAEQTVTAARRR